MINLVLKYEIVNGSTLIVAAVGYLPYYSSSVGVHYFLLTDTFQVLIVLVSLITCCENMREKREKEYESIGMGLQHGNSNMKSIYTISFTQS